MQLRYCYVPQVYETWCRGFESLWPRKYLKVKRKSSLLCSAKKPLNRNSALAKLHRHACSCVTCKAAFEKAAPEAPVANDFCRTGHALLLALLSGKRRRS